jgi:hypothetical protein
LTRSRWTALALLAGSLVSLAGCGGGSKTPPSNATPIVVSVFPAIITAGSQGFTIFVSGTNFQSGSTGASFVFWNGTALSTVLNSSTTQLQASVPASFVVNPNVVQITVANPAPGGGVSNAVSFTIEPVVNSNPFISSISPSMIASGSAAFTLTVNGGNFSTPSPCSILCIDSGSTMGVSPFVADEDFSGGTTVNQANAINTSEVTNPAPVAVYQTARIAVANAGGPGTTFSYTIGGFTANSIHLLRLHFCETFFTAAGSRVFNVSINGVQVLTDFDVFAAAGGENIANIQQFTEAANAGGQYVITFVSVTNNALISGIEIDSATNDVVTWNGQFRTTTFVSSSKLTAQITSADVASSGIASVTVLDTVSGIIASPSVQFTITGPANPTPSISSLSPSTALAGGPDFELIINGSNFVSTSTACFNNSPLGTAFIKAGQLGAWIPAADIALGGVAAISVTNSGFCGVNPASASVNLDINNPVPTIVALSPSTITAGSQNFILAISGTNFISGLNGNSVALWNGSARSTTFNSSTQQLDVVILASDVATSGTAQVTVKNPAPGGGTSAPLSFTIAAPQTGGPAISFLAPADAVAGNQSFTLTVNGSNFVSTDVITWNAQPQITTFVSATQLTTQINGTLIAFPGLAVVAVMPTSGASSPSVDFPINPVPTITSLSPPAITASSQNFVLLISGTNFISGPNATSFGFWNGSPRSTIYNSSTGQLEVLILASDVATSGTAQVTVENPGGPGGSSAASSFTIAAPQVGGPLISSFVPPNAVAGSPSFTLTVDGSNFVPTDVVTWNGQPRTTSYVTAIQLTAQITAADIQLPGFASVAVLPTSGASSPSVDFTVTGPSNLLPTISSISPPSANAGGLAFELTVNGSNFVQTSSVMWNATTLATSFLNSSQLIAWVSAPLIASSGSANVTVVNPAPGGGTSQIFVFTIH